MWPTQGLRLALLTATWEGSALHSHRRHWSFTKTWGWEGILVKLEGFINQVLLEFLLHEPEKNSVSFL